MTDAARQIWSWPPEGVVPDIGALAKAPDLPAFGAAVLPWQAQEALALEADRDAAEVDLRESAAALAKRGIHVDVDRMMRGSLGDRLLMAWDDARFWLQDQLDALRGEATEYPEDLPFAAAVQLASTRPTANIPLDYDVIDGETARFIDGLAAQIAAHRGPGQRIELPETALDLIDDDDMSDHAQILWEIGDVQAYWPAANGPALALSVQQHDGGLPIAVYLAAHGPAADAHVQRVLAEAGGRLA